MNKRQLASSKKTVFKIRLKVGDSVKVRAGKYKGKTGKVSVVHPTLNKVTVEGIIIVKKHQKATRERPTGGIIEITKPIWVGKVGIIEPTSKKPSRIGYKVAKDGTKTRVFLPTGKEIK